jgi:hypothetical protein
VAWPAVAVQVVWGGDDDPSKARGELQCDHVALKPLADAYACIEPLFRQVYRSVVDVEFNGDAGKTPTEFRKDEREHEIERDPLTKVLRS